MTPLDGLHAADCAVFIVVAFALAGVAQSIWLATPVSRRMVWPLDGGTTWRGHRVLGDNKTVRGLVVMVPAAGVAFGGLAALSASLNGGAPAVWSLTPVGYVWLGVWAGIGFMAGELPNSFLKRQLAVPPGAPAPGRWSGWVFAVFDRVDSAIGMMVAIALVVPVPWLTWLYVLSVGPFVHGAFSLLVFRLGGKTRAA